MSSGRSTAALSNATAPRRRVSSQAKDNIRYLAYHATQSMQNSISKRLNNRSLDFHVQPLAVTN